MSEHSRILHARYKQLLSFVSDIDGVTSQLYAQGLLSSGEREEARKRVTRVDKEAYLCSCLTNKGAFKLVDISQVLKNEHSYRAIGNVVNPGFGLPAGQVGSFSETMPGYSKEDGRKAPNGVEGRGREGKSLNERYFSL